MGADAVEVAVDVQRGAAMLATCGVASLTALDNAASRAKTMTITGTTLLPGRAAHIVEKDLGEPAEAAEIAANPRARSAKLRAAERTAATVAERSAPGLPRLPSLDVVLRGRP